MSQYKRYSSYKPTDLDWLHEIPADWQIKPNGRLFREIDDRNHPDLPLLNVSINTGVTVREFSTSKVEQKAEDFSIYKRAKRGDIVFNKMRMWQGAVGVAPIDGLVSPDYTVARPTTDTNPHLFEMLFRTPTYLTEIDRHSHGIVRDRNRLYWDGFKQMKAAFPPSRSDQDAIVVGIRAKLRSLDALIQKKQRLIELLNEKRAALISHAVTKGLDPSVAMRPSGLFWLGKIPGHWRITRLSYVARICNGTTPSKERRDYWSTGTIPWISSGKVNDGVITQPSELISEQALQDCSLAIIPRGSVVI
ncbi:MAG: hypothetical protein GY835_11545, partial [bacterium]|nr:hypothetical protein [bacterium]